jgi:TatD DNase family protein
MSKKRRDIPVFDTPIIETHCHLDYLDEGELAATLSRAAEVGVERIVTIAVSAGNLDTVASIAGQHDHVFATQGIHPHEAAGFDSRVEQAIRQRAANEKILAIGEIGLDYYYDHCPRDVQLAAFERQLQLASELDLPVVIHTREADEDTRAVLGNFSGALSRRGVIHSFTSSLALAEYCLAEGFTLGFNGIVTFNKADNVREVVAATPAERILLETDAPYLTPVPYRGKQNAPYYIPFVAERVAEIKNLGVEDLLGHAYRNSLALFFPEESASASA